MILIGSKDQLKKNQKSITKCKTRTQDSPIIFLYCSGKLTENFKSKLKKIFELQVALITRKLGSCLPALQSSFVSDLESHLVYEINCNGCGSIYVGQLSRHLKTSISEHQNKNSELGQHLVECSGFTNDIEWIILDACRTVEKLMTIEAIYINNVEMGTKQAQ